MTTDELLEVLAKIKEIALKADAADSEAAESALNDIYDLADGALAEFWD